MYMVYCDGLPIQDLRDEELVLIDPKLTLEVNTAGSFEFKIAPTHPQYDLIKKFRSVIQVFHDDEEIFSGRAISDKTDFYNRKNVICEGQLAYLNDSIQRACEYHDMTVRGYLETLIATHNEQVKEVNIALNFNEQCSGESERYDYLSIYYVKGGQTYVALERARANSLAGKTVVIPSNDIYVYWHTDSSVNTGYGFSIDSAELTNAEPLAGKSATLPKCTVINAGSIADVHSEHSPYTNSVNQLWHYTYDIGIDYYSSRMFEVGIVTVTDNNDSLYRYTNYENTLTAIKEDLIEDLGGYIRVRNHNGKHYIDYIAEFDNLCRQSIEFGENLLDFSKNTDLTDIATAIIPLGARQEESDISALEKRLTIENVNNGIDYLVNPTTVQKYGFVLKTVTWDEITTPEMLKRKGEKWLSDNQFDDMVLEVEAVDLHYTDEQIEQFKLYDMVPVHSIPHGLDRNFALSKMTISLNSPSSNKFTLGIKAKSSLTAKTSAATASNTKAIEAIPVASTIVQQAISQATALITAATHGYVVTTANEQLIMDTNDIETASKVWRWNLNGLGYSREGYNGTYKTAITMDGGIVGERIIAGSISGDKLDVTYTTKVSKEIADAGESARNDAEEYTDEQLKSYYTKSEIETSIKNTQDAVLLSAKETATQYVDNKLKSYSTSAQIKVKTDAIESEVSKKVNSSDLSTKIQQNATSVKIAWNNISKYIAFESGELRIYDSAVESSRKMVSKFNYSGEHFYRDDKYLGKIGTNNWIGDSSYRGLVFDLEYNAQYMCWAAMDSANQGSYTVKLIYQHSNSKAKKGLHFSCDTYADGNLYLTDTEKIIAWSNGGCGYRGSMSWCNSNNSEAVKISGTNKTFKVFNNVDIQFYSTLNLNGWGYTNNSDIRLKTNIEDTGIKGLEVVNAFDLKSFDWIQSGINQPIGLIAQQLLSFAPELVAEDENDGHLQLNTDKLVYYCIKAIQELCEKLGYQYDKPKYIDPYTYLEKKVYCATLEKGTSVNEPCIKEPIIIKKEG